MFDNKQPTLGTDPCHIEINSKGTELFVSNFMSGSICVLPVRPDGSIGELSQFIQHTGSSINPQRQSSPHVHSLIFSPDEQYAFVPDLGLDKLMIYKTNSGSSPLTESEIPYFQTEPGAGPRHGAFNPSGEYFYLINELNCTILVLSNNKKSGGFSNLQSVSSLPEGVDVVGNSCADIHITPDGRFLYGSNRGHNSLILYGINEQSGLLEYIGCQPCGGRTPRNFVIDPSGNYLLCANQDSDDITVFKIDQKNGLLKEITKCHIPTPVCVRPLVL
jgi:6-phosphogluconolactonase